MTSNVFNAAQCDGLPDDPVAVAPPVPEGLIVPEVEALIRAIGAYRVVARDCGRPP